MTKRMIGLLCTVGLALALTACGSSGSDSGGSGGSNLTPVTVAFTYSWKGEYAPLVLADEQGYFAKQGLKVTFKEGKGSQVAYSSLGDATDTFVIGPSSDAAEAISGGVPIIDVATFVPVTPSVLVAKPGTTLSTPQDLVGKHVGLRSGADASLFFKAFLKTNGVDPSKVNVTDMNSAAATTAFLNGTVQVVDAFTNNELPTIQQKLGQAPNTLAFNDFGFPILGQGVTVSTAMAKAKPDLVKKFLIAEAQGIDAAKKDPAGAAKALKSKESAKLPDQAIVEQQVKSTLAVMVPEPGHQLGWLSDATWTKMLDLFKQAGQTETSLPLSKYYTNEFLSQ
jgi:NitT/TauT family transport system substrate-binding protein